MAQEEHPSAYAKFFNKDFLTDCTLEKADPHPASYKAHRIVLAANSEYFHKYFQEHPAVSKIPLPKFVKPTANFEPQDVSAKVLEFFYTNQTKHDLIELGLNKKNAFSFLSEFTGLEQTNGKALTQEFLKAEVIDKDNCADCLINAVKADNQELKAKCIDLLVPKFNDLLNDPKKKPSLLNMPLEMFKGILASDNLVIQNENALLNLVIDYIKSKESLPLKEQPHVEPHKAEPPKPEEQKHAADKPGEHPPEKHEEKPGEHPPEKPGEKPAEKPGEKPAEKPGEKPAEKPADKPADKPGEHPAEKPGEHPPEKPGEHPAEKPGEHPAKPAEVQIAVKDFETEAEAKLKLYKLTQEEKRDLVKLLRLTHLTHDALIKASNNELFAEFKDIFIESLSAKLHSYESSEGSTYTLNLKPRHYTEPLSPVKAQPQPQGQPQPQPQAQPQAKPQAQAPASEHGTTPSQQTGSPSKRPIVEPQGSPSKQAPPELHEENPHHVRDVSPNSYIRHPEKFSPPVGQNRSMPPHLASPTRGSQHHGGFSHGYSDIPFGQTAESRYYQGGPQMGSQSYYPGYNEPQQYYGSPKRSMDPETLYRNKFSPQGSKMSGSPGSFQQSGIRSPTKAKTLMSPLVFSYKFDFDDNGVLYYLGSFGKQYSWKNPHESGQVQVFFSSLGKGALGDFVGRDTVNCRTLNEANSFMGVDLGIGRYLIPTCYTIRNRDTDHHVMLNWVLEGSTDLKEWFWIDKRTHYTEDQEYNHSVADVREELKMKGFTSTWGVDENQVEKIKANFERTHKKFTGFRYFKITQVNKNSSGSFNLGLSGFELYGVGLGDNWLF